MRKLLLLLVAMGLAAVTFVSVAASSSDGAAADVSRADTLIVGFEGGTVPSPDIANPFVPARWPMISAGIHQAMFESLFYLNYETGKMEPWLAKGFRFNKAATRLTLDLRKGIRWSDGQPFTSKDVVFTLNMLRTHPSLINGADMQRWVRSAKATGPYRVQIALKGSNPRFVLDYFSVEVWGDVVIVPEHVWKGKNPATFKNFDLSEGGPIATGPYRLVKASSTQFVYDRRDDWWAAKTGLAKLPAPKRLIFVEQGPQDRETAMLRSNQVDALPSLGLGAFKVAQKANPHVIGWTNSAPYAWTDPCPYYFEFNTKVKPWDDAALRSALAYTVDKQKFANLVTEGAGKTASFPFPTFRPLEQLLNANRDLFRKYGAVTGYDPEKAERILESKGYRKQGGFFVGPDGKRLSIQVLLETPAEGGPAWGIAASLFQQFFRQAGIDMKPKALSVSAYQDAASLGQFQGRMAWLCGSVTDPFRTLDAFHEDRALPVGKRVDYDKGAGRWKNDAYSRIVDKIGRLQPADRRIAPLFRQALSIWLQQVPAFGIYQQTRIVPYNTRYWTNWPTAKNNYIHPPNWWMTFHQVLLKIRPAT